MFRFKAYLPLLVLSTMFLCGGVLVFLFRNPSSWLTLIAGVMLWLVGCAMMIGWCVMAAFRNGGEETTEIQTPPRSVPFKKAS